ncbi:hypothetical protein BDP81DRAFT_447440 [Colletotrichum phormii]|uniref:Myb-like DNA-binding domain-containing protein n=1 Tax=Colletotrichum phormii TaxID=359342 RepID=A0AAI9ZZL3_9PEZI|nr:uncharacterized protein BDP81DRAFT_447440 [Colletotrichum phormii]KAK1639828.1 hypothetical protein BDP81DRAFT_447440 [Colletotrichum phormii]
MASVGTDAEGQVTFLVHCIKHSSGGRVDFRSVANDCKIASKAAAAKRFERILKPYGMKTSDLSKNGPIGSAAASPGGASASPKTPGRATPKAKGKRAPTETPTKETKRLKLANHPAVSSYNDEDDAEDVPLFKVKEDPEASGTDSANGSYNDIPRGHDDDDLQLLYVVEKTTSDCPIHDHVETDKHASLLSWLGVPTGNASLRMAGYLRDTQGARSSTDRGLTLYGDDMAVMSDQIAGWDSSYMEMIDVDGQLDTQK